MIQRVRASFVQLPHLVGVLVLGASLLVGCKPSREEVRRMAFGILDACAPTMPPGGLEIAVVMNFEPKDGMLHLGYLGPANPKLDRFRTCLQDYFGKVTWPPGGGIVEVAWSGYVPRVAR